MRRLDPQQVQRRSVEALGLDPNRYSLTSIEAIAGALRRAAGFLCPCAGALLVQSVTAPMKGLISDYNSVTALVEDTLEQLIGLGDLFEYRDLSSSGSSAIVLYSAPCGFVGRSSGAFMLVGISADQLSALPPDLEARIEHVGCVRMLRPLPQEQLRDDLLQLGLVDIPYARWAKAPLIQSSSAHVAQYDHLLRSTASPGDIRGLLILDPSTPVNFYRGRWIEPNNQSGRFVARRSQAYGAPLWCYVHLINGQPQHLLDLPAPIGRWRGCDEAWHLQMAIDAKNGTPQLFDVHSEQQGSQDLLFYSPIPMWAQRRWDAIGLRVEAKHCLFAFRFPEDEINEECQFAMSSLWLSANVSSAQNK
jgi:hypothetical protein